MFIDVPSTIQDAYNRNSLNLNCRDIEYYKIVYWNQSKTSPVPRFIFVCFKSVWQLAYTMGSRCQNGVNLFSVTCDVVK